TGLLAINNGFNDVLQQDLRRAETVSLPLALVLLLVVFGSFVAALVPLGVGVLAVVGGIAGMFLVAPVTDVSVYALNVVTLIGLGVAIDYSLFITNRFREEMRRGRSGNNALAIAMATSGRAITFSGLTVAIGVSGMLFYQGTFLSSMGISGAIVVASAVFYGLTFLPALLAILGRNSGRGPDPLAPSRVPGLVEYAKRIAGLPNVDTITSPVTVDPRFGAAEYVALYAQSRAQLAPQLQALVRGTVGEHIVVLDVVTQKGIYSD